MTPLTVWLYEVRIGTLTRDRRGALELIYDDAWRTSPTAVPLSLSLPLTARTHRGDAVLNYIDNLLPDDPSVRERWATDAGLATTEPFTLLGAYGEDVAGAARFVPDEAEPTARSEGIALDTASIARRIAQLRRDRTSWHDDPIDRPGQFSLAGAQAKFSLTRRGGQWWQEAGTAASTHIFKPFIRNHPDADLVEHLTMRSASSFGLSAAATAIGEFDGERSLIVERFDRVDVGGSISRVHQEDLLQALGMARLRKYERDGGPSIDDIGAVLGRLPDPTLSLASQASFAMMLVYSWLVLNTDAHAKNYSLQLAPAAIALSPLYDASSIVPYLGDASVDRPSLEHRMATTTLSMRYGAEEKAGPIGAFELRAISRRLNCDPAAIVDLARGWCARLPHVLAAEASQLPPHLQTDVVARYVDWSSIRAEQALTALG